jgi:hypothetical protein
MATAAHAARARFFKGCPGRPGERTQDLLIFLNFLITLHTAEPQRLPVYLLFLQQLRRGFFSGNTYIGFYARRPGHQYIITRVPSKKNLSFCCQVAPEAKQPEVPMKLLLCQNLLKTWFRHRCVASCIAMQCGSWSGQFLNGPLQLKCPIFIVLRDPSWSV